MPDGANIHEACSISDARAGRIRVSRLVLTGWGAQPSASAGLRAWSDQGRVWGAFSKSPDTLTLYRRSSMDSLDALCAGTVSAGKVALAAVNDSGISGSADVDDGTPGTNPAAAATFDAVVSYADERDLVKAGGKLAGLLEGNPPTYLGLGDGTRFEALLRDAKAVLDNWLARAFHARLRRDEWGRLMLADITRPGDFARVQALIAAHMAAMARGVSLNPELSQQAVETLRQAEREFEAISPEFDYGRNLEPDDVDNAAIVRLGRF